MAFTLLYNTYQQDFDLYPPNFFKCCGISILRVLEISNKELNWEVSDAPGRTESYALGGMVPGQPGFGVRPMNRRMGGNAPSDTIIQDDRIPNPSDFLEKGGKVKK